MNIKKTLYISTTLILLFIFSQGCFSSHREMVVHDPPLAQNLPKLVKGRTTEAEVLALFGTPDLQADGANITLYPDSTTGQWRAKQRAELERFNKKYAEIYKKHSLNVPLPDPDYTEKIAGLGAYSSIDEEHIALLYIEFGYKTASSKVPTVAYHFRFHGHQNKLLIFINKKTGIVDEFSYRGEFKAD